MPLGSRSQTNPWCRIPLEDYEAHMAHPSVGQASMLANELELAIHAVEPEASRSSDVRAVTVSIELPARQCDGSSA
jgi:hypothetical protein